MTDVGFQLDKTNILSSGNTEADTEEIKKHFTNSSSWKIRTTFRILFMKLLNIVCVPRRNQKNKKHGIPFQNKTTCRRSGVSKLRARLQNMKDEDFCTQLSLTRVEVNRLEASIKITERRLVGGVNAVHTTLVQKQLDQDYSTDYNLY